MSHQMLGIHSGIIQAKTRCSLTSENVRTATAHVTLFINDVRTEHRNKPNFHDLCWGADDLTFRVAENNRVPLIFGTLHERNQETVETTYTVIAAGSDILSVDNMTSELSLLKSLDRETQDRWRFVVVCLVKTGNDVTHKMKRHNRGEGS
ncbi:uncharacterized protein LOC121380224 [Gigantopelta aegis]|uniref:uncharacterized protein LOC121380224 n=1 Tax=Gigantopelta aegis TaxID=1735272 RepID=UPI001B88DCF1|nr:uncharacterized protein LOC121380224 [Gigantopelta aegis]